MKIAPLPANESERLQALYSYNILDTLPEPAFDDLTVLAAQICQVPIALVSLVDAERQWFKSKVGLEVTQTCREAAFCAHAILQPDQPLIVPDTLQDQRFAANPLVTAAPNIRFYAGFPIVTRQGHAVGTLCVIDSVTRQLQPQQVAAMQALSRQVSAQLELRLNLSKLHQANQLLRRSEERFRLLIEGVKDYAIFLLDPDGRVASWNPGAEQIKGYSEQKILGRHFSCFYPTADIEQGKPERGLKIAASQGKFEAEGWRVRQDGSRFWANVVISPLHDQAGRIIGFVKVTRDVTTQKQAEKALLRAAVVEATNQKLEAEIIQRQRIEAQLLHNALHDVLTGLPNRVLFLERLGRSLWQTKKRRNYLFAVLFLDLDRFKVINDSLGHLVGDELLVKIAQRLLSCVGDGDTIARIGGDEFVILLEEVSSLSDATQMAANIQTQLSLPFSLSKQEVFTTASIGIALSGTDNATVSYARPEDILRDADNAMYRAKAAGRARYEVFDTKMHAQALERLNLETDLRHALERQELRLHYQPIVSLPTGRITGFEALIRWQYPERGMVPPDQFIAIAEETGLIVPIGDWVIQSACHQLSIWQVKFPAALPLTMSVNISVKQLAQPNLVKHIAAILTQTNLDAGSVKLEITESVLIENAAAVTPVLRLLKDLGVELCIDDFGTGYSSLSYLHRFPIDILKIDRSFINQMSLSAENSKIVQAVIKLAQALDMQAIAEGIETVEQQTQLQAWECGYGQGYLFSKPVESDTVEALLAQQLNQEGNFFDLSEEADSPSTPIQPESENYVKLLLAQSARYRQKLAALRADSTKLCQACSQAELQVKQNLAAYKTQSELYQRYQIERELNRLLRMILDNLTLTE